MSTQRRLSFLELTVPSNKLSLRCVDILINIFPFLYNLLSQVLQPCQSLLKRPDVRFWVQSTTRLSCRVCNVGGAESLHEFIDNEFVTESFKLEELSSSRV